VYHRADRSLSANCCQVWESFDHYPESLIVAEMQMSVFILYEAAVSINRSTADGGVVTRDIHHYAAIAVARVIGNRYSRIVHEPGCTVELVIQAGS